MKRLQIKLAVSRYIWKDEVSMRVAIPGTRKEDTENMVG